jgi:hypothetical protein
MQEAREIEETNGVDWVSAGWRNGRLPSESERRPAAALEMGRERAIFRQKTRVLRRKRAKNRQKMGASVYWLNNR